MALYNYLNIFFIYSFLGWCVEVIYSAIKKRKFINRGFLNGPLCPIYGFCAILITWMFNPIRDKFYIILPLSIILTTIVELVTGYLLRKIFKKNWWDYSGEKLNYKGYICLKFSLIWGIFCTLVICLFNPAILFITSKVHESFNIALNIFLVSLTIFDLVITILQARRYTKYRRQIDALAESLKTNSDSLGSRMSEITIASMSKIDKMNEKLKKSRLYYFFSQLRPIQKKNNKKSENKNIPDN